MVKSVSVSRQPQGDELEVHLVHMDYGEGRGGEGREGEACGHAMN